MSQLANADLRFILVVRFSCAPLILTKLSHREEKKKPSSYLTSRLNCRHQALMQAFLAGLNMNWKKTLQKIVLIFLVFSSQETEYEVSQEGMYLYLSPLMCCVCLCVHLVKNSRRELGLEWGVTESDALPPSLCFASPFPSRPIPTDPTPQTTTFNDISAHTSASPTHHFQ